ncbi:MAG: DoxX family protein [Desulfuromonadales bacterium GWD2_61_12]|nr:MAG: DoxX family protein [Desulfuromonadales bacterium GWD2_61_12]HBT84054.1 DoxX family protein [Desulfuromonas sp.]
MKWLTGYADQVYALMRIVAGAMFAFHGMQKILGILSTFQPPPGTQLWFGGLIELVGGVAILLGYHTRLAAFLGSGMMAVAYLQFHWKFQLGPKFFPTINEGELAVLYSFVFLYLACRGGVKWCVDRRS